MLPKVVQDILLIKDFRHYWAIGFMTSTARWLEVMAFSVITWNLSGDAVTAGWMFAARMIFLGFTGLVFSIYGNHVSGVKIMLLVQLLVGASCLAPIVTTYLFEEAFIVFFLFLISSLSGILWSVDFSYRRRLLGDTLSKEQVGAGVSLDVLSSHATRLFGMIIGGFLLSIEENNFSSIFLFLASLYFFSSLFYLSKKDKMLETGSPIRSAQLLKSVFKNAFNNIPVLTVLLLTPIFNIFVLPFFTLISLLFLEKFQSSEFEAGLFSSVEAVGALIGGYSISIFYPKYQVKAFFISIFVLLICLLCSGFLEVKSGIILFIFLAGIASSCYSALQSSIIYTFTEPKLRSPTLSMLTITIGTGFLGAMNVAILGLNMRVDSIVIFMSIEGLILATLVLLLIYWRKKFASIPP